MPVTRRPAALTASIDGAFRVASEAEAPAPEDFYNPTQRPGANNQCFLEVSRSALVSSCVVFEKTARYPRLLFGVIRKDL